VEKKSRRGRRNKKRRRIDAPKAVHPPVQTPSRVARPSCHRNQGSASTGAGKNRAILVRGRPRVAIETEDIDQKRKATAKRQRVSGFPDNAGQILIIGGTVRGRMVRLTSRVGWWTPRPIHTAQKLAG